MPEFDIQSEAANAAAALLRAGCRRSDAIAALTSSNRILQILIRATDMLGSPFMPLDPGLPDSAIDDLLRQADIQYLVGDRAMSGCVAISERDLFKDARDPVARTSRGLDDMALFVATSGSTGHPRAVMLSSGALRAAATASQARCPLAPNDRWLVCLPLFHIGGYSILSRCALAGADAVIHEGFDPDRVVATLATERITHLSLVPAMLALLLDRAAAPPPTWLRHVLVGGAALDSDLAARATMSGWPIQPTYGMSETASQVATLAPLSRPAARAWRKGMVGQPLPGVEVAQSGDGRLMVRGPMLMAGYTNPTHRPGDGLIDGWFVTNDVAHIGPDGNLLVQGRIDDVIISGGKKILPALVEEALAVCPGLTAVSIVGRDDAVWGEIVTAVFCGAISEAALLEWARAHVPPSIRPRAAVCVPALPALASGKPDRIALRRMAARGHAQ